MTMQNSVPSNCRNCRYYKPEGRRGGTCQLFHAPVQSHWKSCTLATLPFIYLWDRADGEFQGVHEGQDPRVRLRDNLV